MPVHDVRLRALAIATDVDVLPDDAIVADRGEYVLVRTPSWRCSTAGWWRAAASS